MANSRNQVIAEIDAYMQKFNYTNSNWYVGIAADPRDRLFNDHNVDEENGIWIYREALSTYDAREIERAYLATGHDGGPGGGDDNSVFVYAFVKAQSTVR